MKKSKVARIAVSIEENLLKQFDEFRVKQGYTNRSQIVQDLIRNYIIEEKWESNEKAMGTITLAFDHHTNDLAERLTAIQHDYHSEIISNMHAHLDEDNCLEVIMVKGKGKDIRELSNRLISTRGVKHGKLTLTTGGE